ncbi:MULTISPECIES: 1-acyl-sn-glycerol-3-phosphate acyltransferase [Proteiniphilum]|jgi:hypothetical protein|uniref:1-acyl-sn-glycerol-3-phosphate acyltransferase n=1 Tax=Proteiniphilum TaxID=294702 RepID=UPI001EEAC923|nr:MULTISPECIES: 1-acyl-sn-glycerol-3-phosphate acyltransferase [Proteiniphilum]ULB34162.1 1-acyl-sn-glycerol-3-phosphate acyltransferase [Proteiniphilum propionicum]
MEITTNRFDDIRPLLDSEVPETISHLISNDYFRRTAEPFVKPYTWEEFSVLMGGCKSKDDFQHYIIYPVMKRLIEKTTKEMCGFGWEKISTDRSCMFISNHRDIVLDAAFLNILFFDKSIPTTEIAIGDNLLIYPWIEELVRLNKSFIVKRGVNVRQMLEVSKHLSDYIHYTIRERNQSVWIAQREGRAKDSNDKTQTSLLKMLTLHDSANPSDALKKLNIVPLSITYEFDPCDYLKAKEYQLKRDNPGHRKSKADDIENMIAGIMGYKGRVHFRFGNNINRFISNLSRGTGRNELLNIAASAIDDEIYRNYSFFPFNYVAYDLMTDTGTFATEYSDEDRSRFESYLQGQINKIDIPGKDEYYLREKMIEMYGNTVKNNLETRHIEP